MHEHCGEPLKFDYAERSESNLREEGTGLTFSSTRSNPSSRFRPAISTEHSKTTLSRPISAQDKSVFLAYISTSHNSYRVRLTIIRRKNDIQNPEHPIHWSEFGNRSSSPPAKAVNPSSRVSSLRPRDQRVSRSRAYVEHLLVIETPRAQGYQPRTQRWQAQRSGSLKSAR